MNSSAGLPPLQRPTRWAAAVKSAGPGTDVGDHQDRDQERHHRARSVTAARTSADGQQPGRQRDAGAGQPDQRLDPSRRVHERHGQHAAEREHDDDVREGWHAAQPRCTCEDGRGVQARPRAGRTSVSEQPGRYQRSTSGMVGALLVTVLVILAFVVVPRLQPHRPRGEAGPRRLPAPRCGFAQQSRRRPGLPGDACRAAGTPRTSTSRPGRRPTLGHLDADRRERVRRLPAVAAVGGRAAHDVRRPEPDRGRAGHPRQRDRPALGHLDRLRRRHRAGRARGTTRR